MYKIKVPSTPYATMSVALGKKTYELTFRYHQLSDEEYGRWYLDISYNGTVLITSLKMMENVSLLRKYAIPELEGVNLFLVKLKNTDEPCSRDNFGLGKAYELVYFSDEEAQDF